MLASSGVLTGRIPAHSVDTGFSSPVNSQPPFLTSVKLRETFTCTIKKAPAVTYTEESFTLLVWISTSVTIPCIFKLWCPESVCSSSIGLNKSRIFNVPPGNATIMCSCYLLHHSVMVTERWICPWFLCCGLLRLWLHTNTKGGTGPDLYTCVCPASCPLLPALVFGFARTLL